MSFKIVKTVEDEKVNFTCIPTAWEQDGFLYWPPKTFPNAAKLIKNPASVPMINWLKFPCTVKENEVESLQTGQKLCALYSSLSDTEAEKEYFEETAKRNLIKKKTRSKSFITQVNVENNPNSLNYSSDFEAIIQNDISGINDSMIIADFEVNPDESSILTSLSNGSEETFYVLPSISSEEAGAKIEEDFTDANKTLVPSSNLDDKLGSIDNKIDEIDKKLDFFIKSNAEIKTLIAQLLQKYKGNTNNDPDSSIAYEENKLDVIFPLTTVEALNSFEDQLSNYEFRCKVFNHLIKIGGTSGKQNGEKILLRLVAELFTNSLLCQFTWKGISTSKKNEERTTMVFFKYNRVLDLFFSLMEKADTTVNRMAVERILQFKVFKRKNQRLQRELKKETKRSHKESAGSEEHQNLESESANRIDEPLSEISDECQSNSSELD